jgi:FAD/FMN-containing dehydrogenase
VSRAAAAATARVILFDVSGRRSLIMTTTSLSGEDVTGQLLLPGDPGYDDARRVWNAMVDRRPWMIVRCASVDDVRAALRAAREHDLEVGVRCGGHSVLGLSVPEGGVMVDLTRSRPFEWCRDAVY